MSYGKCENILILVFVILEAYTAIAIVITAKTMVRKEEIERDSMYFWPARYKRKLFGAGGVYFKIDFTLIRC